MYYTILEKLRKNIMNVTTINKIIKELESNLSMLKELNEEVIQPFSFSLHCSKQIDDLLDESMSMEVNGRVYTSQDHATSGYMRNEDLWCKDLDLTCISPWNSSGGHKKAGTLVTPRHVIGAAHYEYSIGAVVRFVEQNSGGRMRTPTDSKRRIFHESKIKGDSGNPAFLIFNGKLVLMTVWTFGGAGGGTPIAKHIADINDMIATADTQAGVTTNYTVTEADFSPDLNKPLKWPTFKYLEGKIVGNLTKTSTMAMDDKGYIHSLGYKSDMHIVTDTLEDSIERKDKGYQGFIGNVKASDGNTYFFPAYSNSIGKLNRSTGEITLEEKFGSCPQIRSGAEGANGIIYMPTYTRTLKIYTYNTATGEIDSFTPPKPTTGGFFCHFGHIWGAASDKKGQIYMPPALNVGATYVESVDKVFCLPRTGKTILVINCADDSYEEIILPADYLKVANNNKNFNGFLAPDGWLYSAFWGDTKCFRVNPHTYEVQWKDYEEDFADGKPTVQEGSGIMSLGTGFSTCALVKGQDVYLGLAGTSKAVKLEY